MTEKSLTPADLQRWRELADAATPGPWDTLHTLEDGELPMVWDNSGDAIVSQITDGWSGEHRRSYFEPEDAAFIAAARDTVPRLLAAYAAAHDSAGAWASRAAASGLQVEACIALLTRAAAHIRWLHSCIEDELTAEQGVGVDALLGEMRAMVEGWGNGGGA